MYFWFTHCVRLIVVLIVWVPFDYRLSAEKHRQWARWAVAVVVGAVVLGGAVTQFMLCVLTLIGWGVSLQWDNQNGQPWMVDNMIITITVNAFKRNRHFCWLNEHATKKSSVYRPIIQSTYTHSIHAQTGGNLVSYSRGKDRAGCLTCRLTATQGILSICSNHLFFNCGTADFGKRRFSWESRWPSWRQPGHPIYQVTGSPSENNTVKQQTRAKPNRALTSNIDYTSALPLPDFNQRKVFLFGELKK